MLIGIISKDEHIKVHTQALKEDGYEVIGLGSSPTKIPPTVDLAILRTESCSHNGSNTAYSWARSTRKPLIVENGLSGIRAKLRAFLGPPQKKKEVDSTMLPASRAELLKFPSQKVSETHAQNTLRESALIFREMSKEFRRQLASTYKKAVANGKGPYFPHIETLGEQNRNFARMLGYRPLHFFVVLQWVLLEAGGPYPVKKDMQAAYFCFCSRKSSGDYVEAAIWMVENWTFLELKAEDFSLSPKIETPQIETPQIETPQIETPQIETPKIESPKIESPQSGKISDLRRDLEDFVLEIAGTNSELLALLKNLTSEISTLKTEVKTLQAEVLSLSEKKSEDPLRAIESLRERGAVISLTFGSK